MGFSPDGSGAYTRDIASALRNYFDYSSEVYSASSTEDQAWIDLLKGELDAGRPISYGGNNGSETGHAFNLDGYNSSDAFHVNWGWSGSYNGYFQITNLTPNGNNFSENATAVLNIMPKDHSPYNIELSKTSVKENLPIGTSVATILVDDPDEDEVFSYTIEGTNAVIGEPYCPFYIDGDSIKTTEIIDYDQHAKVYIKITAVDSQNNEFAEEFTINILKENSVPTNITLSNTSIIDTLAIGSFIGKFTTVDEDEIDTFTYEFEINTNPNLSKDNNKFKISNDSLFTNYDFSDYSDNICSVCIKSSDCKDEYVLKTFNININHTTATFDLDLNKSLKVYPNPTYNSLTISNETENIKYIRIYNLVGKIQQEQNVHGNEITLDLNNSETGLYFVTIELENGQTRTFKIVKKN